jgi:predicted transposase/invertase (TIGR01784 family)
MSETFYYASNDAMFKRIFGDERDIEPLAAFLQAVLDLPPEDYAEVSLVNPFLARAHPDDKQGILDVRLKTACGTSIDIEIQLCDVREMRERIIYYLSRMITDQIGGGDSYLDIKRSICILITDFVLVTDNVSYHNQYRLYDPRTGSEFSDLLEVDVLELPKLPQEGDGTQLWDWLKFVSARRMEVLEMLAEKNPQVGKAVAKLVELNADERARMIADAREKMRRDNVSREQAAREKGREEERTAIARKLLSKGHPVDEVIDATGLSKEQIQFLLH